MPRRRPGNTRAEVRDLLLQGLDCPQVARILGIDVRTARYHKTQVLAVEGAASVRELLALEVARLQAELTRLRA